MAGRARLRPNRGFPATSPATRDPRNPTAVKCSAQKDLVEAPSPNTEPSMDRSFRSPQQVICVGSCVFQGRPGSPGSDGASPYHTSSLHSSKSEKRFSTRRNLKKGDCPRQMGEGCARTRRGQALTYLSSYSTIPYASPSSSMNRKSVTRKKCCREDSSLDVDSPLHQQHS
jgi:hypothetical protein